MIFNRVFLDARNISSVRADYTFFQCHTYYYWAISSGVFINFNWGMKAVLRIAIGEKQAAGRFRSWRPLGSGNQLSERARGWGCRGWMAPGPRVQFHSFVFYITQFPPPLHPRPGTRCSLFRWTALVFCTNSLPFPLTLRFLTFQRFFNPSHWSVRSVRSVYSSKY